MIRYIAIVSFIVAGLLITVLLGASLFYERASAKEAQLDSFECGFERLAIPRGMFSIKFYLMIVVFLVFDLEVVIVFPLALSFISINSMSCRGVLSGVVVVLLVGLLLE
jgi:NADH-ubiquinone oxidoreductase chain 3